MTDLFHIDSYDFELPSGQIAQEPAPEREDSKLLVLNREDGTLEKSTMRSFIDYLKGDEILVVNDTRVVPARMHVTKATGGKVELLILPPGPKPDPQKATAITRSSRPLAEGTYLFLRPGASSGIRVEASLGHGRYELDFSDIGGVRHALESYGSVPLPPYIHRDQEEGPSKQDSVRYQTIFARNKGAVAAPTAGLHFTASLVKNIEDQNIPVVSVTLHVGPGTFLPVRVTDLHEHAVEPEWVSMGYETARVLNKGRKEGRRIVAVGTTVVRTLESLVLPDGTFEAGERETALTILPGHRFRAVDGLLTNFHLPKSSLLLLVSTFAGRDAVLNGYKTAVDADFRFYSYGDAMYIR